MFLNKLFTIFLCFLISGCVVIRVFKSSYLEEAERYEQQGKYKEAISAYEQHMKYRLSVKNRAADENPYFYLLLMGDIELRQDNIEQAIAKYQEAQEKEVHPGLISDRFRSVAHWYEQKEKFDDALRILKDKQALDPLLFDAMLDRISKEIVGREDSARKARVTK